MCGICGALQRSGDPPGRRDLERVNDRLRHRGPDEDGVFLDGPVALGMRRLSILDLEAGSQPMRDEATGIVLVYNGEVYNHKELRDELAAGGYPFRTRCDTEVVLAVLALRGPEGLAELDGMFALAAWDPRDGSVLLARDGPAIKPLYYELTRDRLVWASELLALAAWPGVSRAIDPEALGRYLAHEYVPTPRSILRSVRKLEPGTWLRVDRERERRGVFWAPPFRPPEPRRDDQDLEAELRRLLEEAVERQMVADVPVGIFLSGGLDSSALAAAAVRRNARVRTFAIGFGDPSFDESSHARRAAEHLGTEHHEERLDEAAALDLVPDVGRIMDEPLGDASILPTLLLCRFSRGEVKVALSGDGGDELFGGYPTYGAHLAARYYRLLGPLGPGALAPIVGKLPVSHANLSLDFKAKRFVRGAHRSPPRRHLLWMGSFDPDRLAEILQPEVAAGLGDPWEDVERLWRATDGGGAADRARRLDFLGYLRDDLLPKTDRASMSVSLEVRVPFLDLRLVRWAEGLPASRRFGMLRTKKLMRSALRPWLPEDLLRRPKKGFGVPMARWLQGPLRPLVREMLDPEHLRRQGLFRPGAVTALVERHEMRRADERKRLWTLLAFQLWHHALLDR